MDLDYLKDKDRRTVYIIWDYIEDLQDRYRYLQWGWNGFGPMIHEGGY